MVFRNTAMTLLIGLVVQGASAQGANPAAQAGTGLVGIYWKAVELAGISVAARTGEPHVMLGNDGRFSGSDGCNQMTGTYTLKAEALTFGQMAGTLRACAGTAETEQRFRGALKGTSHWNVLDGRLRLMGATGKPLAVFERAPQPSPNASLQGTAWRLLRFQGGDDRVLVADDPAKYTVDFGVDGRVALRLDCNRGRGAWKAAGSQLEFGPLTLTRAQCAPGSLHDQIARQWTFIRSFVIRNGHLFLALMADGGTYEFEPSTAKQ